MIFLDDAERLFNAAQYMLACAISNKNLCKRCVAIDASEDNKGYLSRAEETEKIMHEVIDILKRLLDITKLEDELINRIDADERSVARDDQ